MSWSIFDHGGKSAAALWAHDALIVGGCPTTPAMVDFVFDWEVSEGGGGLNNPTNCGPLTFAQCDGWHLPFRVASSTGEQYGGGAADYATREDGIKATVNYWHMDNYTGLYAAMKRGDADGARQALIASPWAASHYHGHLATDPLPEGWQPAPVDHGKPPKGLVHPVWWTRPTDGFAVGWRNSDKLHDNAIGVESPSGTPLHKVPGKGWVAVR